MRTTTSQCISTLLLSTVLAGCGLIPAQHQGVARARPAASPSSSAGWADIMKLDRDSVLQGQLPPEVIQYDLQIAQLIPEGEAIMTTHDQAKARIWSAKMNTINLARNKALEKMAAREMANSPATSSIWNTPEPDACLSPMGKNICTTPSSQQQSGSTYTAGPGGIGANVGGILVGPGGIGGQ